MMLACCTVCVDGRVLLTLCRGPLGLLRNRFAGGVPGSLVPKRRNQGGGPPQVSLRFVSREKHQSGVLSRGHIHHGGMANAS